MRVIATEVIMIVQRMLEAKGHAVHTIRPTESVADAAAMLTEKAVGALVVSQTGDTVNGILSERDIVRGLTRHGGELLSLPVRSIMTTEVRTCTPEDSSSEIMALMTEHRIRHLPVLKDRKLCGIISIGDVVKDRIDEVMNESEMLKNYVMGI